MRYRRGDPLKDVLACPGSLLADNAGDPELSGLEHALLFKKLPRPARKGGRLFQTTGLFKEELLQPRRLGIVERSELQITGDGLLMLGDRRLPFAVEFNQSFIKPQLRRAEGKQFLDEFKGLLLRETVKEPNEGDLVGKAGRRLLSHELAHVVQQRENPQSFAQVRCMPKDGAPETHAEKEKPAAAAPARDGAAPAGAQVAKEEKAAAVHDEKAAASKEEKVAAPVPLPNFSVFGKPSFHTDFAQNVTFSGRTDASFDGGKGHTENLKAVPATDCKGCGADTSISQRLSGT